MKHFDSPILYAPFLYADKEVTLDDVYKEYKIKRKKYNKIKHVGDFISFGTFCDINKACGWRII